MQYMENITVTLCVSILKKYNICTHADPHPHWEKKNYIRVADNIDSGKTCETYAQQGPERRKFKMHAEELI